MSTSVKQETNVSFVGSLAFCVRMYFYTACWLLGGLSFLVTILSREFTFVYFGGFHVK